MYKIQTAFDSPGKSVEGILILLTSGSLMTSQVRSKVKYFTVHGCSMECVIISSKTNFIEKKIDKSVSCLVPMLLKEVTGIRSDYRGQVNKGQRSKHETNLNIGTCDACFLVNFSFPAQ